MMLLHRCRQIVVCCAVLSFVFSIVTSHAAELFVADRASDSILAFDEATGDFLRVVAANDPESESLVLAEPTGMTFGPDGFLYVSNSFSGFPGAAPSVVKIDPVTGTATPFIETIIGAGGIAYHEPSDTLFVSEFGNFDGDEVFRYDATGTLVQTLSGTLASPSSPTGRTGITFDDDGNLYVSEFNLTGVGSVMKYEYSGPDVDPSDDYSEEFTTFASGADVSLLIPAPAAGFNGLAFDGQGNLFVASLIGQALVKFTVENGEVVSSAPFGSPIPYPSGVVNSSDGNVLVTSLGNDNPTDPFYQPNTFPGNITRFNSIYTGSAPFLVGDINRDTVVDDADLALWQATYGMPFNPQGVNGDLDGDFDTDGRDFSLWQRGFGNSGVAGSFQPTAAVIYTPAVATASVPEPNSAALVTWALAAGTWFCRKRVR